MGILGKTRTQMLRLLVLLMLGWVTQASAQEESVEIHRNLALRAHFSETTGQNIRSGDRIDLLRITDARASQSGADNQPVVSFIANNLILTSLPRRELWEETADGYRTIATILINVDTLADIVAAPDDGYFLIVRKP